MNCNADGSHLRTLIAAFEAQLGPIVEVQARARSWASATFAGTRHAVSFSVEAAADVGSFAKVIGETDITLRQAFVADIAVVSITPRAHDSHRVAVEVLVIDDV